VKKCLFPLYAFVVSCAKRSKNLESYLAKALLSNLYIVSHMFDKSHLGKSFLSSFSLREIVNDVSKDYIFIFMIGKVSITN
jgi:hypothetical protein